MADRAGTPRRARDERTASDEALPRPTVQFKIRSWRMFQRALDPLGPPRPLPPGRRQR